MDTIDDTTVRIGRVEPIDTEMLAAQLPATIVLELVNPKDLASGHTTELAFAEPTGKHMEQINQVGTERAQYQVTTRIIGECCGIGAEEYNRLGTRDISRLSEVLAYFLTGGSGPPE